MQCPKCGSEVPEHARFCGGCGARLPRLCPQCGASCADSDRFCVGCGKELAAPSGTGPPPRIEHLHTVSPVGAPPALEQRMRAAASGTVGENRLVTVMFADISGFTPMSRLMSPEDLVAKVDQCFRVVTEAVYRHEGSINKFIGDCVLAFFGAPIAHENDPERAILSALDIQADVAALGLKLSVGINSGMMYFGPVGTGEYREVSAYGSEINLAQRLQSTAEGGSVVVGESTYRMTRRAFTFRALPPLSLKGVDAPVTAFQVVRALPRPDKVRGIEGLHTALVGRERELRDLEKRLEELEGGRGCIVSLIGQAGVGKSRLVAELKGHTAGRGVRWLEGRCASIGRSVPYLLFTDMLTDLLAISTDDSPGEVEDRITREVRSLLPQEWEQVAPVVGKLLSVKGGEQWARAVDELSAEQLKQRIFRAVRGLVEAMARSRPLLLILEDLHWADDLSLDLISFLMEVVESAPVMLLCCYRPERELRSWRIGSQASGRFPDRYAEVQLTTLGRPDMLALLQGLLSAAAVPDIVRDAVVRKTGGNPFFIEEVVRSLIDSGAMRLASGRWEVRPELVEVHVPEGVQGLIMARIDRLGEEARFILQSAAVIGKLFRYKLLRYVLREETRIDEFLQQLQEKDFIYEERSFPEEEYSFRHELAQEAAYRTILSKRRKEFHRRIAEGYEELYAERIEEFYADLAYHFGNSDDDAKAVRYLILAGEKAASRHANETALKYFQEALARGASGAEYYRVLRARGLISLERWKGDDAVRDFEELLSWSRGQGDRALVLEAEFGLARGMYMVSLDAPEKAPQAKPLFEQALRTAEELGDRKRMLQILEGLNWFLDGTFGVQTKDERLAAARRQLDLANEIGTDEISAAWKRMQVLHLEGRHAEAQDLERKVARDLEVADRLAELKEFYFHLMWHHVYDGDVVRCVECCDEGTRLAAAIGALPVQYPTIKALGLLQAGRFGEAWQSLQQEVADASHAFGAAFQEFGVQRYRLATLDYERARDGSADMIAKDRVAGREWMRGSLRLYHAAASVALGCEPEVESPARHGFGDGILVDLVKLETHLRRGQLDSAASRVDEARASARKECREHDLALIAEFELRLLLAQGRPEDAVVAAEAAVAYASERGYLPLVWRMHVSAAEALERQGKAELATRQYRAAAEVLRTLAGRLPDDEGRRIFLSNSLVASTLRRADQTSSTAAVTESTKRPLP